MLAIGVLPCWQHNNHPWVLMLSNFLPHDQIGMRARERKRKSIKILSRDFHGFMRSHLLNCHLQSKPHSRYESSQGWITNTLKNPTWLFSIHSVSIFELQFIARKSLLNCKNHLDFHGFVLCHFLSCHMQSKPQ